MAQRRPILTSFFGVSQTLHSQPNTQSSDPNPHTQDLKPQIQTPNLKPHTLYLIPQTSSPEPQTRTLHLEPGPSGAWHYHRPGVESCTPSTLNRDPKTPQVFYLNTNRQPFSPNPEHQTLALRRSVVPGWVGGVRSRDSCFFLIQCVRDAHPKS